MRDIEIRIADDSYIKNEQVTPRLEGEKDTPIISKPANANLMALLKGGQSQLLGAKAQEDAGDGKPVSRLAGLLAKGLMKQENTILKDEKGVIIDQGDGQKKLSFFSRKK